VGKKLISASSMVLMPHAGCHDSGWYAEIERHIFLRTSKRPLGVKKMMFLGVGFVEGPRGGVGLGVGCHGGRWRSDGKGKNSSLDK
jgi:hypothetical protein